MSQSHRGTKQHFLPATHIGSFSASNDVRKRNRHVWVMRRGGQKPYRSLPENVAAERDLYTLQEQSAWPGNDVDLVDKSWDTVERSLNSAIDALISNRSGSLDATHWVKLVSFIAQLFVRGREFNDRFDERMRQMVGPDWQNLVYNAKDNTNVARLIELQRLLAPVMYADWLVLHNRSETPFVLNDIGYCGFQDMNSGDVGYAIPLSKNAALMIARGDRTTHAIAPLEYREDRWVAFGIRHQNVGEEEVVGMNMTLGKCAINEVYGATPDVVLASCSLQQSSPTPKSGIGPDHLIPDDNPRYAREHEMDFFKLLTIISKPPEG